MLDSPGTTADSVSIDQSTLVSNPSLAALKISGTVDGTPFENVRVRALRLPGQPVKGRKCGDAARGSWKDAAEETQRFREGFGAAIGVRDKKCGTPQGVR